MVCVVEMEIDHPVEMAHPAIAAGVVGQLGLHETGGDGDDAVDVALIIEAGVVHHGHDSVECRGREGIRLGCRYEAWGAAVRAIAGADHTCSCVSIADPGRRDDAQTFERRPLRLVRRATMCAGEQDVGRELCRSPSIGGVGSRSTL